ncbi:unnamed protein product [[Candida] boidinii]|nr:unnamed protein product [[Candida] boidinii]
MLNEINKNQQIPTDENIHPSNLRHLKSKTLIPVTTDIQQQQQLQQLQQPIQYQQQQQQNDIDHIQYQNQQIINPSSEQQHYFLQQSTQRSRSALTNLNIDNNSIIQPSIQNNSKLQSRNIRQQQQQQQQQQQNIIPDTQIDQSRILNRRKSDVLIRPDTKENDEIIDKDNKQENHINGTTDSSNEAIASSTSTSTSTSSSSSSSSSSDEEIIRGDQRRISLKRQATESSTDLLAQTNKQELKKQRIDWDDLDADDYDDPLMKFKTKNEINFG